MSEQEMVKDVDWLLASAYVFMQTQKFNLSTILLETVLVVEPNCAEGYRLLSYSYFKQERFKDAFGMSQKWQKLPKSRREMQAKYVANMFLLQAKALRRLKRLDLAKKCYTQYLFFIEKAKGAGKQAAEDVGNKK